MSLRKNWRAWLKLIGFVLLSWLLWRLEWGRLGDVVMTLKPGFLVAYFMAFALMVLVRMERLHSALLCLGGELRRSDCYLATVEPALWGLVTPGRLGEFSRLGYIARNGVSLEQATSIVLVERAFDVSWLLATGASGLLYLMLPGDQQWMAAGVLLFSGGVLFALARYDLQPLVSWFVRGKELVERPRWVRTGGRLVAAGVVVLRLAGRVIFGFSALTTALNFLQIFFLAKAFGFHADMLVVVFASAIAALVSLLPISVAGLGTREATYITIMAQQGISQEAALLFSLLDGIVFAVLMLVVMWLPTRVRGWARS